jgi:hypothetical protein
VPSATSGTTVVWRTWVSESTTVATSTDASGGVWNIWCDSATTTASTSNAVVWYTWNGNAYIAADQEAVQQYVPAPETEEQKQVRLQKQEERRTAEEARKKAEVEAREKAERLLISTLNPVQLRQLKEMDAFIVELETKRYKIRRGYKVIELDKENKQVAQYCIHPSDYQIPSADVMLAQKLMLEHNEAAFLRIANRTPVIQ